MSQAIKTDWNVDKYFDETEPEHHWDLRRQFIVKNKEKYPEDYLIALSRVFTNIEFMGCSYNKEVMNRVAELSEGIVESYRTAKKQKLQRTFVKASDAAESRASGNRESHAKTIAATHYESSSQSNETCGSDQQNLIQKARSQPGFRGQLVIIRLEGGLNPWSVLQNSLNLVRLDGRNQPPKLKLTKLMTTNQKQENLFKGEIDDESIGECYAPNEKEAKKILGVSAIEKLQETCFIIEQKRSLAVGGDLIEREKIDPTKNEPDSSKLQNDNIGMKLLKLMGWSGKGLGKDETGREDIVEANGQVINRSGLGFENTKTAFDKDAKNKLRNKLRDFKQNADSSQQIIFAADFSSDERKFIHGIAHQLNLRSKSYGSGENRQLVITKKISHWELVGDLLSAGGSTDRYTLLIPKSLQN